MEGACWQVGTEANISVYFDKWISRGECILASSTKTLQSHSLVESLKDHHGGWNQDLICDSFSKQEADAILSIPLFDCLGGDRLIWHHTNSGIYTIKSGYWIATRKAGFGQASSSNGRPSCWKKNWDLNIPGKIKHFCWKTLWDWLPYRLNLVSHDNLDTISTTDLEHMVVLSWRIWYRRNKLIHDESYMSDVMVVDWARDYLDKYQKANANARSHTTTPRPTAKWSPPPDSCIKVNTNASIMSSHGIVGMRIVCRDSSRVVLAFAGCPMKAMFDPLIFELKALLKGVTLAMRFWYTSIVLE
ncbi:uncharacterized protein LOC133779003 [Humulus lupulus]|uniref:uncharacterized protein LOC133779003 n=1 Tax=Humulus lupulus TaxID=3486 RepID=UPI002B40A72C|nr:uncharacterized protein LOC133779003 [Humulus lupulus]